MAIAAESQFHVLAVDDSFIDRKIIERLLRTSSFQGIFDWRRRLSGCPFFDELGLCVLFC